MKNHFSPFSGIYFPVRGPTMEPMKIPTSSTPIKSQSTVTPLIMKLKIERTMLIRTARPEVPAATNIGSPTTLVRKGTYRNPPPTPMNEEMALMKKPPTKAQIGLKPKVCPKKANLDPFHTEVLRFNSLRADVAFLLDCFLECFGRFLGSFLAGLPLGRHFINHETADYEHDQAEIALVRGKLELAHGGVNHQEMPR